jgi:hypothetical protein
LIKRASILLLAATAACTHLPTKPNTKFLRLGVIVIDEGYVDYDEATADVRKRWDDRRAAWRKAGPIVGAPAGVRPATATELSAAPSRPEADPPYVWSSTCAKRFVTRYTRVRQQDVKGKQFSWLLLNSCKALPPRCGGKALELKFNQWEYTPEILYAGMAPRIPYRPTDRTPFVATCQLTRPVYSQTVSALNCKFRPDVEKGSYKFQAVLQCGGKTLDNWDPEIIIDDDWKDEGEGDV